MARKLLSVITITAAVLCSTAAFAKGGKVQVIAHRGFWNCEEAGFARNSIAALRCAQQAKGIWGSEFDVNVTADGIPVVFHDGGTNGMKFNEHNFSEYADVRLENGESIPTLDAFLEQAARHKKTMLVMEIKAATTPEFERLCIDKSLELLRKWGLFSPKHVMFISFSHDACKYLAGLAPGFDIQYLHTKGVSLEENIGYGANGADLYFPSVLKKPERIKEFHDGGQKFNVWTVNEPADMASFISLGVDQITSDRPLDVVNQVKLAKRRK